MEVKVLTIIAILVNFALLIAIIIVFYKAIKGIRNFINRNKELDKKVDIILSILDKEDNK